MNRRRLLRRLMQGSLNNVAFDDFVDLVRAFGYEHFRTHGSHHLYTHSEVPELLNLQSQRGEAKPYQIRDFLHYVEEYGLWMEDK